jgi:Beta-lactamase enzyme family
LSIQAILAVAVCELAAVAVAASASTGDRRAQAALASYLPRVQRAAAVADGGRGGPDAVQRAYDAARDLEEALLGARPVSAGCRRLFENGITYARAEVGGAEGVDRLLPRLVESSRRRAAAALHELQADGGTCRTRGMPTHFSIPALEAPKPNGIVIGMANVRARAQRGATRAVLVVNHRASRALVVAGGRVRAVLRETPGRYSIGLRFFRRGRAVGARTAPDVWILPAASNYAVPAVARDDRLSARLRLLGRSFRGYAGIWVHDLVTGRVAGWNEEARFPAASTVKLAVLVAGLQRAGPEPTRSSLAYDLETLAGWSSNLASNRLLLRLGGSEAGGSRIAQATLARLGASASTFTGFYRVGTAVPRDSRSDAPPLVSSRVTTARDLGRILYLLHAGALGVSGPLRALRLTKREAQVGLNLLLSSQPSGDNLGLFRPSLGRRYVLAQKNGWISTARHTAGILYGVKGPKIVVVLTYRTSGIARTEAARFAQRVLAVVPH